MNVDELMDQAATLKEALVGYATSPGFSKRRAATAESTPGFDGSQEESWIGLIESVLFNPDENGHESLLDRYLRTNKNLAPVDRSVYEDWQARNLSGIFRVKEKQGAKLVLHNLIDELEYDVQASAGAESISGVRRGGFVMTRILPIGPIWTLSGTSRIFAPKDLATVKRLAAKLLEHQPSLAFRNPDKAERARAIVRKHHEIFLRIFGSHLIRGTGAEAIAAYQRFLDACGAEIAANDAKSAAQTRSGEQLAPMDSFPQELAEADDVALFHHPVKSVNFLTHYSHLEEAHRVPPTDSADPAAILVRGYVEDDTIEAFVLEDLASRFPDTVDALYRAAFARREFTWEREGEGLLRRFKPRCYREDDLPTVAVVPELLEAEFHGNAPGPGA